MFYPTDNRNPEAAVSPQDHIEISGDKLVLFPGKIIRKNGALAFHGPLTQFFLTVTMGKAVWLQKVSEDEEVCIGVRAKYIRVDDIPVNDTVSYFGNVETRSMEGLDKPIIYVRIGKYSVIVKAESVVGMSDGDAIRLHFSRTNAVLFRCPPDNIDQSATQFILSAA
jgi:hypothetical protein